MREELEASHSRLDELANEILSLKRKKEELSDMEKKVGVELETAKKRMVAALEAAGVDSAEVAGYSFSLRAKLSVRLPSSDEERTAFFDYLKNKGLFEQMISVNSNTLNSWYRGEAEAALEQGDIDFSVPGINNVSSYIELGMRKK